MSIARWIIAGATLVMFSGVATAGPWEAIESLPQQTPVRVLVNDRPRNYFRLTPGAPLTFALEGPTRLRVLSRAELVQGSPRVVAYRLQARAGSRLLGSIETESSAASRARVANGKTPVAKSRRMVVNIPAGRQQITLAVNGVASLLVRLQQAPAGGIASMVTLTPVDAPRSVTVTEGEKTIPYYTTFASRPVRLRVVGPTILDLTTRLDFDRTMRGTQTYRLAVFDGERRVRELRFRTTKSSTAAYPRLRDYVPSKFDRAQLRIGEGSHEIAVQLLDPKGAAVEVHARIPEPSIGSNP